jgi:putative two-component system response regulator
VQEDRQTRHASLALGCKDFISKPIDLNELRLRIGNQLENRSLNLMMRDQNILLEEKVSQRTEALQSLQLELIQRLADAAEYRDNETGVHVKRMSHFSQCIGRFFGLDEEHQSLLLKASPMHDIGKIGISDSILLKPGKYTPEEFEVMKQHTWIGARILGGSRFELIQAARDIALCHHERWNGEGYPRGLSGEDIPLLARIVSIADVFDALTMVRPYKTAWTTEAAYNEITTMSGSYFDPQVVEAFKAAFEEILQIRAVFSE